jgi:hypothetical protein
LAYDYILQKRGKGDGTSAGAPAKIMKPCPFCGGDAEADRAQGFRRMSDGVLRHQAAVYCTRCSASLTAGWEDYPELSPDALLLRLEQEWDKRVACAADNS